MCLLGHVSTGKEVELNELWEATCGIVHMPIHTTMGHGTASTAEQGEAGGAGGSGGAGEGGGTGAAHNRRNCRASTPRQLAFGGPWHPLPAAPLPCTLATTPPPPQMQTRHARTHAHTAQA